MKCFHVWHVVYVDVRSLDGYMRLSQPVRTHCVKCGKAHPEAKRAKR